MDAIQLPITGGTVSVDVADLPLVFNKRWRVDSEGYASCTFGGKKIRMHRLILDAPKIDHRDRNKLNNTRSNLRPCTEHQNQGNAKARGGNFKGISRERATGKWVAQIWSHGHKYHLGTFSTPEDAARAYDRAAIEHFGEFALLNFPQETAHA